MGDISKHFSWREFQCHDGTPVPEEYRADTEHLVLQLEAIRDALGNVPVHIMSGYRTPLHNLRVHGAKHSQHMVGKAADIQVAGVPPVVVHATIKNLINQGKITQGGLGLYVSFVHYDIRGHRARWVGEGVTDATK